MESVAVPWAEDCFILEEEKTSMVVTNTYGLLRLVQNASGRNRSVYEEKFISDVDPDGAHLLAMSFPHNDVELRTKWFCKMKDSDEPVVIWLDVDFDVYEKVTCKSE